MLSRLHRVSRLDQEERSGREGGLLSPVHHSVNREATGNGSSAALRAFRLLLRRQFAVRGRREAESEQEERIREEQVEDLLAIHRQSLAKRPRAQIESIHRPCAAHTLSTIHPIHPRPQPQSQQSLSLSGPDKKKQSKSIHM